MDVTTLLARLLAVTSASTIAACGSSGASTVGTTTTSGSSGAAGAGGGSAGTSSGSGGFAGVAGTSASAGMGGSAGESAGGMGGEPAGGASGAAGSSPLLPCPPVDHQAPLTCFGGAGKEPDGCGVGTSGGDIGCYVPGSAGTPAATCLPADDPSLAILLGTPCESYSNISGSPSCRTTMFSPATQTVAACCYFANVQGMCKARPLLLEGIAITAKLARTTAWVS